MASARPTKRGIKIVANQRKDIELDFVRIVKFLYTECVFNLKNEDKDACFLLLVLFLNTKIKHSSFP